VELKQLKQLREAAGLANASEDAKPVESLME
jgi:hypothetical protein